MKIYPAIDIKGGKCVRLLRGDANSEKEYGDPVEWAPVSYTHLLMCCCLFSMVFSFSLMIKLGGIKNALLSGNKKARKSRGATSVHLAARAEGLMGSVLPLSLIHI